MTKDEPFDRSRESSTNGREGFWTQAWNDIMNDKYERVPSNILMVFIVVGTACASLMALGLTLIGIIFIWRLVL